MTRELPDFLDRTEYTGRMKGALVVDPRRTAIVTIDMQRKYLDESVGESVVLADEAKRVVDASERLLAFARQRQMPVIHAYVARRPAELAAEPHTGRLAYLTMSAELSVSQLPHRSASYPPDRPVGSPQAEVPRQLVADGDIHVTTKKSLDSFHHTDLEYLLHHVFAVDTAVLIGINTDTCVYSTTFSAANRGFKPIVIADCVASMRGRDSHWMALELMSRSVAWVLTLDEFFTKVDGEDRGDAVADSQLRSA